MQTRTLPIPDGLVGERADAAIAKLLGFSRSFAAEVIEAGGVTVNERAIAKSDRLPAGGWLEVQWRPREAPTVVAAPVDDLAIVHQDDHIVVVDKPVGVAAHPTVGWDGPTVLGGLAAMGIILSTSGAAERQGVVHRLDAGTSGLMVLAKSELAYAELKRAFHDRDVDKVYHTVVEGRLDPLEGTIDAPVGRHPGSRWKFAVVTDGKRAITHYETLEAFPSGSLVEIHLETGRTHQIRVHMAAQRHPCVGDTMYGADPTLAARLGLTRQWLHAVRLGFRHPSTGEYVEFESQYPDDLRRALDTLTR